MSVPLVLEPDFVQQTIKNKKIDLFLGAGKKKRRKRVRRLKTLKKDNSSK